MAAVILKNRHQRYMADREDPAVSLNTLYLKDAWKDDTMCKPQPGEQAGGGINAQFMPSILTKCYKLTTGPGGEEMSGFLCDSPHRAVET